MFQSKNKSLPVKGVVVSASNCSGKTHLLRTLSADDRFKNVSMFEMDKLGYFNSRRLKKRLPAAWGNYNNGIGSLHETELLAELLANIRTSTPPVRLIKLKLVNMMSAADQFATIIPRSIRHSADDIRFLQILEEHFEMRIVHISLIPGLIRLLANFYKRRKLTNLSYVYNSLKERNILIKKATYFEHVIRMPFRGNDDEIVEIIKDYLIY